MLNIVSENSVLTKNEILDYYFNSIKPREMHKIGLEYERISLDFKSGKNADYEKIKEIIKCFAEIKNWTITYDETTIIGAKSGGNSISLEPGCQFEISLAPRKNISEIEVEISELIGLIDKIG